MVGNEHGVNAASYVQCIDLLLMYNPEVLDLDYDKMIENIRNSETLSLQGAVFMQNLILARSLHKYRVKALQLYKELPTHWESVDELLERLIEIDVKEREEAEPGRDTNETNEGNST